MQQPWKSEEMRFQSTFSATLRREGRRFTFQNIMSVPRALVGVYVLYYRSIFIYVGKAAARPIQRRLEEHYNGSHNEKLAVWIRALDGDVMFNYESCDKAKIDDLERSMIHHLQPHTNQHRYETYVPAATLWRKAHG